MSSTTLLATPGRTALALKTEQEMLDFGADFAKKITIPAVIELIGDVGAGKTTFTRGLARGLGIEEPITSPRFTISKRYRIPDTDHFLVHYDFYRLPDPGLMMDDLAEAIADTHNLVVLEWADSVKGLLPEHHQTISFALNDDGSRTLTIS